MKPKSFVDNLDEDTAKLLVREGLCVHSFYVPDCNGCRERELVRFLSALVLVHENGFFRPVHGLSPKTEEDLWDGAKAILERVHEQRGV